MSVTPVECRSTCSDPASGVKPQVGLVGLGLLGLALAERLLLAGYRVHGFDIDPDRLNALAELGGEPASSAADAASGARIIITCLMTAEIVWEAVFSSLGIADAAAPGSVLVDVTTCAPRESRKLADALSVSGVQMLDAPLSGSSSVAREGKLLAMVGGPATAYRQCRPLLETFSSHIVHLGENGAGSAAKLVTNLILGLNRLALAEGLSLGLKAGLDAEALVDLLGHSAAASRALEQKGRRMITGDFNPEARLSQHLKDVRLIREFAQDLGASIPTTHLHEELLSRAVSAGLGELDNSAIIEVLNCQMANPTGRSWIER